MPTFRYYAYTADGKGVRGRREALDAKETYIFTHPKYRFVTDERSANIAKAFDSAAESPLVADVAEAPMALGFVDS